MTLSPSKQDRDLPAPAPAPVAPYNPALHLSEEAQDLILDFIRCDTFSARATTLAFCQVSRHWLDSGRRALYRAPFNFFATSYLTGTPQLQILATLESHPHLASNVRSLERLSEWARVVPSPSAQSQRLPPEARKWHDRIVELCHNVTSVELCLDASEDAKRLGAIVSSRERVRLLILHSRSRLAFVLFSRIFAKACREAPEPRLLDHLEVIKPDWLSETVPVGLQKWSRTSTIQAREYSIKMARVASDDIRRIIPSQSPQIRAVHIETAEEPHLPSKAISKLAKHLPDTLESLTIRCNMITARRLSADNYPPEFYPFNTTARAPDVLFTSFPNLLHLTLQGFRRLTLPKITLLSKTCIRLRTLDLEESTWDMTGLDVPAFASAFGSSSFPALDYLHLGTLPLWNLDDNIDLQPMVEDFASRGVTLEWDGCDDEDECGNCDGEGWSVP
ncbi:hypothetical protein RQP46_009270 [Phenoliferia psychrophenolica]